jgi:hypothetical protein
LEAAIIRLLGHFEAASVLKGGGDFGVPFRRLGQPGIEFVTYPLGVEECLAPRLLIRCVLIRTFRITSGRVLARCFVRRPAVCGVIVAGPVAFTGCRCF